jgi:chromosome partitioning protein
MSTRILGIVFQKGGSGKTTTAINLAAAFAHRGQPTLIIDYDPQASATTGLGADPASLTKTVKDMILAQDSGQSLPLDTILATADDRLHLLPADITLSQLDTLLGPGGERVLAALVKSLVNVGRWDWIVIDSPPNLDLATLSVLLAARELLIPAHVHYFAQTQLPQLFATISTMQRRYEIRWDRIALVPTMYEAGTIASTAAIAYLRREYGEYLSTVHIRKNVAVVNAQAAGKPVQWYDPRCAAAEDYESLATEILADARRPSEVPVP